MEKPSELNQKNREKFTGDKKPAYSARKLVGFLGGILILMYFLITEPPGDLDSRGWLTAGVGLLMAIWWITEAIPIPGTALIPVVLFPIFGITNIQQATAPYANYLIFLFLGGFLIALAMQRWELHRRIALNIIGVVGTQPSSIIMGFIIASAFLSMWVSNTATAMMMLPIGTSVLYLVNQVLEKQGDYANQKNFSLVLLLSIAYACNIGGIGTLIGTPPNALLAGYFAENYNYEISFINWFMVGLPLVIIALPLVYLLLTKLIYPIRIKHLEGGKELIQDHINSLGKITHPEKIVAGIFSSVAILWIIRPLLTDIVPGLSDAGIAILGALVLFMLPAQNGKGNFVLETGDLKKVPWDVLILFGGGLSLASAISDTGLANWIANGIGGLQNIPFLVMVILTIFTLIILTEMTSNTATTATFIPVLGSIAIGLGQNPLLLTIPAAMGASCAFMLPVATPPNAVVYSSGKVSIPQMAKAGIWLNLLLLILISLLTYSLILIVFDIQFNVQPDWAIAP